MTTAYAAFFLSFSALALCSPAAEDHKLAQAVEKAEMEAVPQGRALQSHFFSDARATTFCSDGAAGPEVLSANYYQKCVLLCALQPHPSAPLHPHPFHSLRLRISFFARVWSCSMSGGFPAGTKSQLTADFGCAYFLALQLCVRAPSSQPPLLESNPNPARRTRRLLIQQLWLGQDVDFYN